MENIEYLTKLLNKTIKKRIKSENSNSEKISNIESIIQDLLKDPSNMEKYLDNDIIKEVLQKNDDKEEHNIKNLKILEATFEGIKQGYLTDRSLNQEFIDKICEYLESESDTLTKSKDELLNKIILLYDKVTLASNTELISDDLEFEILEDIFEQNNLDNDKIKEMWNLINNLNIKIAIRILGQIPLDKEETVSKRKEKLDEDILRTLFEKNGFDYDKVAKTSKELIRNYGSLNIIEELLVHISNDPELNFINSELNSDNIKNSTKASKLLANILIFSTPDLLISSKGIAKNNGISISTLYNSEPGIYRKGNPEGKNKKRGGEGGKSTIPYEGSQETYKENVNALISMFGATKAKKIVNYSLENVRGLLSKTPPYLFNENLNVFERYNLSIFPTSDSFVFPALSTLKRYRLEKHLSGFVEVDELSYIDKYRTSLAQSDEEEEELIKHLKYIKKESKAVDLHTPLGQLRRKQILSVEIPEDYFMDLDSFGDFTDEMKEITETSERNDESLVVNNDKVKMLDLLNEETDPVLKNIRYVINGVVICKPKALKNFGALVKNGIDSDAALLYSMTKDTVITPNEFESLKNSINYGGKAK